MPKQTDGWINAPNAKPPRPLPSAKGFEWPKRDDADQLLRERFAAGLQEVLAEKGLTHNDVVKKLWGTLRSGVPRSAKPRGWVTGKTFPTETQAAYAAQLLEVPLQRFLTPSKPFDPHPAMVKGWGKRMGVNKKNQVATSADPQTETPKKRAAYKKRVNGHDIDTRWVLPAGVERPHLKIETSQSHSELLKVELTAEMPAPVVMAIMSMVNDRRDEAGE